MGAIKKSKSEERAICAAGLRSSPTSTIVRCPVATLQGSRYCERHSVEEYLRLHAEKAICEKGLNELREAILPHLAAGAATPIDLPYRLVRRLRHDLLKDYKTPLFDALKEMFRLSSHPLSFLDRAKVRLEEIESTFATRETETLCVEINKEYAINIVLGAEGRLTSS